MFGLKRINAFPSIMFVYISRPGMYTSRFMNREISEKLVLLSLLVVEYH